MHAYVAGMTFETSFKHVFKPGNPSLPPLLLLHGTGGTEQDLIGLSETVAPGRALLSPRGQVLENGMPRFFRRFAEGVLDEDDIRKRSADLATFITDARQAYGIAAPVALGYSNGANIAAALLLLYPELLSGAVLLRAMAPFKVLPPVTLPATKILLLSGQQDQMIPQEEAARLAIHLEKSGAKLEHKSFPTGHGLTQPDVTEITRHLAGTEHRP